MLMGRLMSGGIREFIFIKYNMLRNINSTSLGVKASVSFLVCSIPKENALFAAIG